MNVGTKSILYGSHAFWLHPWFVFASWWKLFGFPWDIRLWVAFFLHDLGYWGKPNMDGEEGETHPEFAAKIMTRWFGKEWGDFVLYHSRFYSKKNNALPSKLCFADKMAICLTPWWLYLPMASATGEIEEYIKLGKDEGSASKYTSMNVYCPVKREWYRNVQTYIRAWVQEHIDGREDTWTPGGDQNESK